MGSRDPTDDPGSATTTEGSTTATTTTSYDACAHNESAPKGIGPDGPLVDELNRMYMGFDDKNATSPNGITLRMLGPDMDTQFFCGTPCYSGYPDCRISSSLLNNKMMIMRGTNNVAVTMNRNAGLIYNQTSIEAILGKCIY